MLRVAVAKNQVSSTAPDKRFLKIHLSRPGTAILAALLIGINLPAAELKLFSTPTNNAVQIDSNKDEDWRLEASTDLVHWSEVPGFGVLLSGKTNPPTRSLGPNTTPQAFYRTVKTDGLFDPSLVRTISLTFTQANWATLLASGRTSGLNVPGTLSMDNGAEIVGAGARYKGNTSYTMAGARKSVNLVIDHSDPEARLMGYKTVNLNNAAGDETIMREPVYFNLMRQYVPCPRGAMAKLYINGAYWGVYSLVQQENSDLINEWFSSNDGDRWRAPNVGGGGGGRPPGGGGGGFASAGSAFSYLGPNVSSYSSNYELKSDNSTNAWQRLVHAIDVLNNTPSNQLRDKVEDVFAVDRWLWFLALEIIFADDDSYWNKGADYGFYYEVESGRIHPVQHDGNEAFTAGDVSLSPVQGATGTNRPLLYRLLPIAELRQRYLAHMRTVLEESFNPAVLTPIINQFHQLTVAGIAADPKKTFSMAAYTNDLVALKGWVTNRHKFLTNHAELLPLAPKIVAVYDPSEKPGPTQAPFITAEVQPNETNGTNGIDSVWLYWRDKNYGRFSVSQMFDDGAHGDGAAGDHIFGGATTNYPAGHKVHYYVEARSANAAKAASFSPARAEEDTYSYRVALVSAPYTPVVINEIMASNSSTLADPQGEYDDWIELHNITGAEVDLAGYYLSDESNNPRKWQFPEGTRIAPDGYLIVWADEDGSAPSGLHASFKLSAEGETILLTGTDANLNAVLDSLEYGVQQADISFGRSASNADAFQTMVPTPGSPNK